ncbi:carboxypeptidase-like regulatory domain-containing protein [Blastopirellula sp. JC732]|uniref:Carboxypeptidase-like regulatory domain-containing protein n=1 Tax=Blastopirellula sediminis TaxID=2894196 RepID=A0A9X1MKP1_9BACT|nr:carboxypeptidase-like regulatory domain-containing protein [Blastopirellula sediminis]MCC9609156.1 carboxypeptidase-like regulatory domain-containing protein [Blastopirellula sediminis]MCC9628067.1 carboxypeptidase-like regulatory domain-containing protein [Blastopirellula sediminis]
MFQKPWKWLAILALASAAGCGSSRSDLPDLVNVTGKITVDGKQVPGLRVVFEPEFGRRSVGMTNESGEFYLEYLTQIKGAVPGKHTVKVTWEGEATDADPGATPTASEPGSSVAGILIPSRYNIRSELSAIVSQDKNQFEFALSTKRH